MSIVNVLKAPPVWSPAYNPIIWMVDSNETTQFKFRYVFDVYIYEQPTFIRFKVPPNPEGKGLIDVSSLVAGELNIAENVPFLSALPFYSGEGLATTVYLKVGEEYSTTIDGQPVLYNGMGATGQPDFPLYADGDWRPAPNSTTPVVAWASGQGAEESYNYYATSGEAILAYEMNLPNPDVDGKFLTRCPDSPQTIRSDEDFTLTWLNWNFETEELNGEMPYSMRATFYDNNVEVGYHDYLFTVANGGTGWTSCSNYTGVTGDNYWLYSFKINPSDPPSTYTRDQDQLFNNWGTPGSTYQPVGEIFPGYHDVGLSPAYNYEWSNYDDQYLQSENCFTSVDGYSALVYKDMVLPAGSTIQFVIPSQDTWGTTYPELYLWGCPDPATDDPANWIELNQFDINENPNGYTEYSLTDTIGSTLYGIGLRTYVATGVTPCTLLGPFATPQSFITVTSPWDLTFDKFCLDLHKYETTQLPFQCVVDADPISETICLEINDDNCWGFQPIRFTWMNNLGGRDWFTFMKRNTNVQQAQRTTMFRVPGYWSAPSFSIQQVNPSRWGTTVFNVDLTNTWTASTDWITEEQSEWLRSMFASPSVFAYLPGRTQPVAITITDANYSVETYARQKLFQYFVSFTEAQPDVVQGY